MQPLTVVGFDERGDLRSGAGNISVGAAVDLLLLWRAHEAFGFGIVIHIAEPAHARLDVVAFKQRSIVDRGILGASIAVMEGKAATKTLLLIPGCGSPLLLFIFITDEIEFTSNNLL